MCRRIRQGDCIRHKVLTAGIETVAGEFFRCSEKMLFTNTVLKFLDYFMIHESSIQNSVVSSQFFYRKDIEIYSIVSLDITVLVTALPNL